MIGREGARGVREGGFWWRNAEEGGTGPGKGGRGGGDSLGIRTEGEGEAPHGEIATHSALHVFTCY